MDKAIEFTQSVKFILAFLVMILFIGMFAGEESLYWFLLLVLIGMVLINSEKIIKLVNMTLGANSLISSGLTYGGTK